jgi:hypothetical protein
MRNGRVNKMLQTLNRFIFNLNYWMSEKNYPWLELLTIMTTYYGYLKLEQSSMLSGNSKYQIQKILIHGKISWTYIESLFELIKKESSTYRILKILNTDFCISTIQNIYNWKEAWKLTMIGHWNGAVWEVFNLQHLMAIYLQQILVFRHEAKHKDKCSDYDTVLANHEKILFWWHGVCTRAQHWSV